VTATTLDPISHASFAVDELIEASYIPGCAALKVEESANIAE
jgi:hypothetical protein